MKNPILFLAALAALSIAVSSCGDKKKEDPGNPIVAVTGVSLDKTVLTLTVGATETLEATVSPADATNKTITWSSDDDNVATVDPASGEITAVALGKAVITATTEDGGKTAECEVTVVRDHVVYMAGFYSKDKVQTACYWIDGERCELAMPDEVIYSSYAHAIAIYGGKVYVAGEVNNQACYWVDGERHDLPHPVSFGAFSATGIAVAKDRISVSGNYMDGATVKAGYWDNGKWTSMKHSDNNSYDEYASGITIAGESLYVSTYYSNSSGTAGCSGYYKDGVRSGFYSQAGFEASKATGIVVRDNKVYMSVNYQRPTVTGGFANYSIDGSIQQPHYLPDGYSWIEFNGIDVEDGEIYLVGTCSKIGGGNDACYKIVDKDNKSTMEWLEKSANVSKALGIDVMDGVVYVAGSDNEKACCWIDGELVAIDCGDLISSANAIVVDKRVEK